MNEKGKIEISLTAMIIGTIAIFLTPVLLLILLSLTSTFLPSSAIDLLERQGYAVIEAAEYDDLNAKLDTIIAKMDDIAEKADAAVTAAENAVDAAVLAAAKVDLFNTAERFIFPGNTSATVTLVAGDTNAWSNWTVITDSAGGNLSAQFAISTGYIVDMQIFDHSAVDKKYQVEIAYGAAKNIVGRVSYHTSFADNVDIKSELIPVGETVYYRMMSDGANGATAKVGFRYIYE